jgi:hypothetical protein
MTGVLICNQAYLDFPNNSVLQKDWIEIWYILAWSVSSILFTESLTFGLIYDALYLILISFIVHICTIFSFQLLRQQVCYWCTYCTYISANDVTTYFIHSFFDWIIAKTLSYAFISNSIRSSFPYLILNSKFYCNYIEQSCSTIMYNYKLKLRIIIKIKNKK